MRPRRQPRNACSTARNRRRRRKAFLASSCISRTGTQAEGIVAAAAEKGCDLIVMASHGRRGIGRLLLGSQANEVLTHSKVPTLIVR